MSILPDWLTKLFTGQAKVLSWYWVPDDHVYDGQLQRVALGAPFVAGDDYVVLRLSEMYLKTIRMLWRDRNPVVHAFVEYGDPAAQPRPSVTAVAGPGQLKDLGAVNLDRLIGLSYRLAGPFVYDGQDIDVVAGLYAVPVHDGAKPLVDTLSQLAGLMPGLAQASQLAGVLKTGVDGLLGLADTELVLGIRDTFKSSAPGRIAKPGFLVAINAPETALDPQKLWIKDGRLYLGDKPPTARPFDAYDMMLFELHRGPSRLSTFATLPALVPRMRELDDILRTASDDELKPKLNASYRAFEDALRAASELTAPDRAAIRSLVADDLTKRVTAALNNHLFEVRDATGAQAKVAPRAFSARSLPEVKPDAPLPARPDGQPLF